MTVTYCSYISLLTNNIINKIKEMVIALPMASTTTLSTVATTQAADRPVSVIYQPMMHRNQSTKIIRRFSFGICKCNYMQQENNKKMTAAVLDPALEVQATWHYSISRV